MIGWPVENMQKPKTRYLTILQEILSKISKQKLTDSFTLGEDAQRVTSAGIVCSLVYDCGLQNVNSSMINKHLSVLSC